MSAYDAFAEKFRQLLREIPADTSLPEWQYLYRQVIFSMGMQILERFPEDAVGPDPSAPAAHPETGLHDKTPPAVPASGGQGGGGHPHVCSPADLASFALCIQPGGQKKPTKPKK